MQRLSGLDASFLYMETKTCFMHVSSLMILDPSTSPGGFSFEKLKEMYASRLDCAPPFRRRLVEVPFGLHHPQWIEDPDFDLSWHLRKIILPKPGSYKELADLTSRLVAIPLDRTRPLWETWLIEGLDNGHVGLLSKVHHAAIDGASGEELMIAILDLTPEIAPRPAPDVAWKPDTLPTETDMFAGALKELSYQPILAAKTIRRTVQAALRIRENTHVPDATPQPLPFSAPNTSFNLSLTPNRCFSSTSISLSGVKEIKNMLHVTVNDVVLTLCSGALRHYFEARLEAPDGPLIAMIPVSVRSDDQQGTLGNQVSSMLTTLATDIDDPIERLFTVHAGMAGAKVQHKAIGAHLMQNWAEFAAPAVAGRAARMYSRMKMADLHRPLFNLTISNVPGPPFPLYVAGAKLMATYPIGPIYDGGGLNITVMSYQDNLDFGLNACPELVVDIDLIAEGLNLAYEELAKAAKQHVKKLQEEAAKEKLAAVKVKNSTVPKKQAVKKAAAKRVAVKKPVSKKAVSKTTTKQTNAVRKAPVSREKSISKSS